MDIEVQSLSEIKNTSGRDLDESINEETLVSGEKADGTFGVFKLFAAIKKGIDWITSIGGNKNFTGEVTINSKAVATTESVNNALANYEKKLYTTESITYRGATFTFKIYENKIVVKCENNFTESFTLSNWTEIGTINNNSINGFFTLMMNSRFMFKLMLQNNGKVNIGVGSYSPGFIQDEDIVYK